jgi:chlorite dismutase
MKSEIATEPNPEQSTQREFLKYTFFKLDSEWKRLGERQREIDKQHFGLLIQTYASKNILKCYSLVGIRGDCDFLLWCISRRLEDIQQFIASLLSSNLGKYLTTPYSYLAMTRKSEYLGTHQHEGQEGLQFQNPTESKYLFVYPFIKKREWYFLRHEERTLMMAQHFKIGHKYPNVKIHTGYSFGLDDQEFVLAFEADQPSDFLELVMELRSSEASRYTALETPIFTCANMGMTNILNMLG